MKTARNFACVPLSDYCAKGRCLTKFYGVGFCVWVGGNCSRIIEINLDSEWMVPRCLITIVLTLIKSSISITPPQDRFPHPQDTNPMHRIKCDAPGPRQGRRKPGPPERGRWPLCRRSAARRRRRGHRRARHDGRTHCARVWFTRQNCDSRQDIYADCEAL